MRLLLFTLLLSFFSCADAVDEAPRVAKLEQGVLSFAADGGVRVQGLTLGSHLGAVIVTCPGDGGYVAGAPGDDSVWSSSLGKRLDPNRLTFGLDPYPVACVGQNANMRVLVGGVNNTYALAPDGGRLLVFSSRTDSFATSPGFLAAGNTNTGVVRVFTNATAGTGLINPTFDSTPNSSPGVGSSVAWSSTGQLVVGVMSAHAAGVLLGSGDGGVLAGLIPLPNPDSALSSSDYGRVVLAGDVLLNSGEEFIIAAPALGRVYIFSGTSHVATLRGTPSFGASLALEPGPGLRALWIGEPEQNRVWRFVGTQGTVFPAPPAGQSTRFGAAIAVDSSGIIAVGAPNYGALLGIGEIGAVFEARFDAGMVGGTTTACDAGSQCSLSNCTTGVCVGDVFCQQTLPDFSDCTLNEQCDTNRNVCVTGIPLDAGPPDAGVIDAGVPDAGAVDAGALDAGAIDAGAPDAGEIDAGAIDAGVIDAGSEDAGVPDAGSRDAGTGTDAGVEEVVFDTACGCTSGGLPLVLLALAITRRRRRQ